MGIPPFSFDICNYDETLNHQIREIKQQQFGEGDHHEDVDYQHIIKNFNL
jgi:hypothetical protein